MPDNDVKTVSLLTFGTYGDIIPYISLGLELQQRGYKVRFITGENFKELVESYELEFYPVNFNIYELLSNNPELVMNKGLAAGFISAQKYIKPLILDTCKEILEAVQGSDIFVFHPVLLIGPHIAEKLNKPSFVGLTAPSLTPTKEFAPAGLVNINLGPANKLIYHCLNLAIIPFFSVINKARTEILKLEPRKSLLNFNKINGKIPPVIYCFSEHVCPRPQDWENNAHISGYWFLQEKNLSIPDGLEDFLESGPKPIYIGFGSMSSISNEKLIEIISEAVELANVRAVISTGLQNIDIENTNNNMFFIKSASHDWLFEKVQAVVHHGGAGTTGAGLKAGKPTIICPFLADQFFWGDRIHKLKVGPVPLPQKNISAKLLAQKITQTLDTPEYFSNAKQLSKKILSEKGQESAVNYIEKYLND